MDELIRKQEVIDSFRAAAEGGADVDDIVEMFKEMLAVEIPADVQAAYLQGQIDGLRWGLKRIREIGKRLSPLTEPFMERSRE